MIFLSEQSLAIILIFSSNKFSYVFRHLKVCAELFVNSFANHRQIISGRFLKNLDFEINLQLFVVNHVVSRIHERRPLDGL